MLRLSLFATCVYCWGTAGFDDWRPPVLEMPLRRFAGDINELAAKGVEVARQLPYTPAGRQIVYYRQQASDMLYIYFSK